MQRIDLPNFCAIRYAKAQDREEAHAKFISQYFSPLPWANTLNIVVWRQLPPILSTARSEYKIPQFYYSSPTQADTFQALILGSRLDQQYA